MVKLDYFVYIMFAIICVTSVCIYMYPTSNLSNKLKSLSIYNWNSYAYGEYRILFESEEIISKKIKEISFETIGSPEFIQHHAYLNKLNMQEMKNILTGGEDIIMTQFIDHDKLKLLIKELYTVNTFKEKVYPTIKDKIIKKVSEDEIYETLIDEINKI